MENTYIMKEQVFFSLYKLINSGVLNQAAVLSWLLIYKFSTVFIKICCISDGEKPENKQKRMEQKYSSLQIVSNIERLGTAKVGLLQLNIISQSLFSKYSHFFVFWENLAKERLVK